MTKLCSFEGCNKNAKRRGLCHNHYMREYRKENIEKFRKRDAAYYANNKEQFLARCAEYRELNKDKIRERKAKEYLNNPEPTKMRVALWVKANREKHNSNGAQWAKNNKDKVNAKTARYAKKYPAKSRARFAKRRAAKYSATPSWANHFFIEEIYDLAQRRTKATGFKWHVDHIVPLQGKTVCGLHVENNLQVIPARDNISKKNRWWPDMPTDLESRSPVLAHGAFGLR